jgi:hypothetical protein
MFESKQRVDLSDAVLIRSDHTKRALAWRTIALWMFFAFDFAGLLFLFTGVGWWFLLPVIAFPIAWWFAYDEWPFFGSGA